ncbi:MAG: hypothetical protein JWN05_2549 [Arthrobacter sp.]|jgi:hypothetical protein|nr:hypothetical protein [Arthrobacter sp.]
MPGFRPRRAARGRRARGIRAMVQCPRIPQHTDLKPKLDDGPTDCIGGNGLGIKSLQSRIHLTRRALLVAASARSESWVIASSKNLQYLHGWG